MAEALALSRSIKFVESEYEINPSPSLGYPRKLRVRMKNETGKRLVLLTSEWSPASEDELLTGPKVLAWQVYKGPDWSAEQLDNIKIEPGETFRFWLGVNSWATHAVGAHEVLYDLRI